jgi:hypothetical protein
MNILKRLLQIAGGSFLGFWALFGAVAGLNLIADFSKHPLLGPLVGGVMLLLGGLAFVACMRLVFNRPSQGGMFSPFTMRVFALVFLLLPIGGLFTGFFLKHPLAGAVQALAYLSIGASLWRTSRQRETVHAIDPEDPIILAAVERVRASLPELAERWTRRSGPVFVKFPFATDGGATEYLWGELLAIEGEDFRADIGTPPVTHGGRLPEFVSMPLAALRDWIEPMADGRARGGYFSRAEISYCRFHKQPVPEQMLAMEFADA